MEKLIYNQCLRANQTPRELCCVNGVSFPLQKRKNNIYAENTPICMSLKNNHQRAGNTFKVQTKFSVLVCSTDEVSKKMSFFLFLL